MKKQLLSLLVRDHTKKELLEMIPGLTVYGIDQARLHASLHGEGAHVPRPTKVHRQRMDNEKLAHALEFFFNPLFHQISSYGTKEIKMDNGEIVEIPEVVRTICHANLIDMYQSFCEESGVVPLSRASLFHLLQICPASKRSCLKGLDNIAADDATAFETLYEIVSQLKSYDVSTDVLQQVQNKLSSYKVYLKTDFKIHISTNDPCGDHCIKFALSDPLDGSLQTVCLHEHKITCDRCSLLPEAIQHLKDFVSESTDITPECKLDFLRDIEVSEKDIVCWKQHIVRTINQDLGKTKLLDNLEQGEILVVMDWAMKFLPLAYREKQSDWFAQKGINWHVSVCIFKDMDILKHRTYDHLFDQTKQDWFAVASVLEHTLCTIKMQVPEIHTAYLRSDNAGCYHCGNLFISLFGISERTGICIRRYDFSETQAGKSYCDSKIAHLRSKIRQHASTGNNVKSASEMKTAIDAVGGVVGCQAAHVDLNMEACPTSPLKQPWNGISKIHNIELRDNHTIVAWKAFEIGGGQVLKSDSVRKMCPNPIQATSLVVISDFKLPSRPEGIIHASSVQSAPADHVVPDDENVTPISTDVTPQDDTSHQVVPSTHLATVFPCVDPSCTRMFQTERGLESHILLGKHSYRLCTESVYDGVRQKWHEHCLALAETSLTMCASFHADTCNQRENSIPMGWALKRDKKPVRFSQQVRTYLRGIFDAGERGGSKANPADVARNMRICRNDDGNKMFGVDEYLQPSQIASYFSLLSVMKKTAKPQNVPCIDDEDLTSMLDFIETVEAMDVISD